MRIRVTFSKTEKMRYTSHLDLHRTWERMLRRGRLPLAYSQGFNPRPKINLAAALPLGFVSDCEIVEFWLSKDITLNKIEISLQEAAPPGIEIQTFEVINSKIPKIPTLVVSADYEVTLLEPKPELDQHIEYILSSESIPRERRGKLYDLRPLIESLQLAATSGGGQILEMRLAARTGATGRPDEVLLALEIDPNSARIKRKSLNLKHD